MKDSKDLNTVMKDLKGYAQKSKQLMDEMEAMKREVNNQRDRLLLELANEIHGVGWLQDRYPDFYRHVSIIVLTKE